MTNVCVYDCAYCVNRRSNEVARAKFEPRELADLTIEFYRRNYIEGLFLSSGVIATPDYTTELMVETLSILRREYGFRGYIHAKAVPGTSEELIERLGRLADRISVNLELPSMKSLALLAPQKTRTDIFGPMRFIRDSISEDNETRGRRRKRSTLYPSSSLAKRESAFAPAGQSTQMIIGATGESDNQILALTGALYRTYGLKRVFFSAYLPVNDDARLPNGSAVQLDREHRLYQADWLLRFYRFDASELIDEANPFLDPNIDPKIGWALAHLDAFPIEVNCAPMNALLRVPGIGPRGARKIVKARRATTLRETELKRLGIAFNRARFFICANGRWCGKGVPFTRESLYSHLATPINGGSHGRRADRPLPGQLSLFSEEDVSSKNRPGSDEAVSKESKNSIADKTADAIWGQNGS